MKIIIKKTWREYQRQERIKEIIGLSVSFIFFIILLAGLLFI
jgi:hypothetical protein